jgi:7-keto-8-aminopelargonate synthetase-like enzyme
MFSWDGSVAPLGAYLRSLPRDGLIVVDDAHGAGVLGNTGKGTPEAEGVGRRRIVQCITLSKAFGVYGGAVLGSRALRDKILTRSRLFLGCTPLPPPLANAALTALRILKSDGRLRRRLLQNTSYVKEALQNAGVALPQTPGPVVPVHFPSDRKIADLKQRLLAGGIYFSDIPAVRRKGISDSSCRANTVAGNWTGCSMSCFRRSGLRRGWRWRRACGNAPASR